MLALGGVFSVLYALLLVPRALERLKLGLSDWAFDVAFFHNLIFHASRGDGFVQTASTHELDGLLELSHAFLLLPAYVPIYRAWPELSTLMAFQVWMLGLSVVPLMALGLRRGLSPWAVGLLALSYCSAPPLLRLGLADLNPLLLGIPLLLGVAWALEAASRPVCLLLVLLACAVREELPILVAGVAVVQGLQGRVSRRRVLEVLAVCVLFFVLSAALRPRVSFYIPFLRPWELWSQALAQPDSGVPLTRKLEHLSSYLPSGQWGALLAPVSWLMSLPLLAYQLFVSGYEWWHWRGPYVHHLALLFPLVALSSLEGVSRLKEWGGRGPSWMRWGPEGLLLLGVLMQLPSAEVALKEPLGQLDSADEQLMRASRARGVETLLAQIPPDAPVASDYVWMALLSGRPVQYAYQASFLEQSEVQEDGRMTPGLDRVTYLLLDETHEHWRQRMEHRAGWQRVASAEGYRLYRKELPETSEQEPQR